jgi:hypothetical protein
MMIWPRIPGAVTGSGGTRNRMLSAVLEISSRVSTRSPFATQPYFSKPSLTSSHSSFPPMRETLSPTLNVAIVADSGFCCSLTWTSVAAYLMAVVSRVAGTSTCGSLLHAGSRTRAVASASKLILVFMESLLSASISVVPDHGNVTYVAAVCGIAPRRSERSGGLPKARRRAYPKTSLRRKIV